MGKKIAIIKAGWHNDVVDSAENSFKAAMKKANFAGTVDVINVPGSLEIPLIGKKMLEQGYDMAIGMGFVVNGSIYRHEFVAQAVIDGIVNVSLQTGKPFLSVVLTPITFSEASKENADYFINHMVIKGKEAANAALAMFDVLSDVKKAA